MCDNMELRNRNDDKTNNKDKPIKKNPVYHKPNDEVSQLVINAHQIFTHLVEDGFWMEVVDYRCHLAPLAEPPVLESDQRTTFSNFLLSTFSLWNGSPSTAEITTATRLNTTKTTPIILQPYSCLFSSGLYDRWQLNPIAEPTENILKIDIDI